MEAASSPSSKQKGGMGGGRDGGQCRARKYAKKAPRGYRHGRIACVRGVSACVLAGMRYTGARGERGRRASKTPHHRKWAKTNHAKRPSCGIRTTKATPP